MERKMNFLVLGANGMAGHTISLYLLEQGHNVITFSTTPITYGTNIVGDACNKAEFVCMLHSGDYDIAINCIGLLNQTANNNPSLAVYLNSFLPHLVADELKNTKARLIHMSTDCVFSGKTGGYTEGSARDGETFYDRTKALGEVVDNKNLTFRNSIIGPDMSEDGIGLFNWFMKQNTALSGYVKAIWTGVTTLTLAKAMEYAAYEGITGLFNLVNNQTINKYEMLSLFNNVMRDGVLQISPVDTVCVDKSLRNTRTDFSFQVPSYEQMVLEMKDWIYVHRNLYPHYFR